MDNLKRFFLFFIVLFLTNYFIIYISFLAITNYSYLFYGFQSFLFFALFPLFFSGISIVFLVGMAYAISYDSEISVIQKMQKNSWNSLVAGCISMFLLVFVYVIFKISHDHYANNHPIPYMRAVVDTVEPQVQVETIEQPLSLENNLENDQLTQNK